MRNMFGLDRYPTDEQLWVEDGERNSWRIESNVHWIFKLPVIRHVRFIIGCWFKYRTYVFYNEYRLDGLAHTAWVLFAIRRGWA
jgi:hypothetical protein